MESGVASKLRKLSRAGYLTLNIVELRSIDRFGQSQRRCLSPYSSCGLCKQIHEWVRGFNQSNVECQDLTSISAPRTESVQQATFSLFFWRYLVLK